MPLSWIDSANVPGTDFTLANLPFGVVRHGGDAARCAVAIGEHALDLAALEAAGLVDAGAGKPVFGEPALNAFMALGPAAWARVRDRLTDLLAEGGAGALRDSRALRESVLMPLARVVPQMPFRVSGYTDFNAGRQHAFNAGSLLRGPENALPANWLHLPIGYNGRASTVVVSGTPIRRPLGQTRPPGSAAPVFGPSRRLDFELEMGAVVGLPSKWGEPLTVEQADGLIFGYVLLNDWSARDIQAWETVPLGPFQGKAFGTSISPWVVTKAALEPFRTATPGREVPLLPYLIEARPLSYDISLTLGLLPEGADRETVIVRSNARHLYYSPAQMLAHHAIGGCLMQTGDLLGTGTISAPERTGWGSLLELSWGGRDALSLDTGEERRFLEDGDTVTIRGHAGEGAARVGFGLCEGKVVPAPTRPG
jgi:fumarylacetoacetase